MRKLRKAHMKKVVERKRREKRHEAHVESQRFTRVVHYLSEQQKTLDDLAHEAAIFSGGNIQHHVNMIEHILSSSPRSQRKTIPLRDRVRKGYMDVVL